MDLNNLEFPNILKSIEFGEPLPFMVAGDVLCITYKDGSYCTVTKLKDGKNMITYDSEAERGLAVCIQDSYELEGEVTKFIPLFTLYEKHFKAREELFDRITMSSKENRREDKLLKLQRHYGTRHCMVEGGYISVKDFCEEALQVLGL